MPKDQDTTIKNEEKQITGKDAVNEDDDDAAGEEEGGEEE